MHCARPPSGTSAIADRDRPSRSSRRQGPGFTTVDLDARLPLGFLGLNDDTYVQFNVTNLFDKLYVGNFAGVLPNNSVPFVSVGAPRAFSLTLNVAFR